MNKISADIWDTSRKDLLKIMDENSGKQRVQGFSSVFSMYMEFPINYFREVSANFCG
jgi:hypothetical protein